MQWSLQLDKLKSVNKSTKYCILRKVNWNNQNNPLQLFRCRKHTPCCGFLIISVNRSYLKLSKASLDCCFPRYWYILLWRRDSMSCWYSTCRLEDIQHVGIWEWETMKWWKKAWMLELITANILLSAPKPEGTTRPSDPGIYTSMRQDERNFLVAWKIDTAFRKCTCHNREARLIYKTRILKAHLDTRNFDSCRGVSRQDIYISMLMDERYSLGALNKSCLKNWHSLSHQDKKCEALEWDRELILIQELYNPPNIFSVPYYIKKRCKHTSIRNLLLINVDQSTQN